MESNKSLSSHRSLRSESVHRSRTHPEGRSLPLEDCRALVLDAAFRPLSVINWHRAIKLDVFRDVEVLAYYDCFVPTVREAYPVPAVLRSDFVIKKRHGKNRVSVSRKNVLKRDRHRCVYCGSTEQLTVDHLVPTCRGGRFEWENLVTACTGCNSRKGDRTLEQLGWKLKTQPKAPTMMDICFCLDLPRKRPKEWLDYIGHLLPANP